MVSPAASVSSKRSLASSSSAAKAPSKPSAAPSSPASSKHSGRSRSKSTAVVLVDKLTAAAREGYAIGLDLGDMTMTRGQTATRAAASVASGNEPPEDTPELVHLHSPQAADEENLGTPSETSGAVPGVIRLDTPPIPPAPLPELPPLEFYAQYTITLWREENLELTEAETATVSQHLDSILGRATQLQAWTVPSGPEYEFKTTYRLVDEGLARTQIVVRYPLFQAHNNGQSSANTMYDALQGKIMGMLEELLSCPVSQKLWKKQPTP
ncbi:uncharacterized protein LOC62_03G003558 [Vanrija pseudolonga]|uniref:Uncharacterized protein n=1 Tax=Vanrija pseudolonga TaxID=143232 RepID=A0AAF0Y4L6_9TREE|nr:hypothetical protein LOC62_03G003558 [Vanrija pseudolonga]